ncbi:MAG: prepilin-type N-terminal cleavage/methylation domain-containing protein [Phycisphaeraceae bacterium]|nr:prepilin-type N-terminal cleavage/methylation domain-containing protein [Phycisphaeraceae bacterium]
MNGPAHHRGFTLVETLATCAIAALAMALGAALLTGAGDPLPRAEQTFLEAHAMARLVALSDGPATMRLEGGRLMVHDGQGNAVVEREWPAGVKAEALVFGVHFDRLGHSDAASVLLVHDGRRVEIAP